MGTLGTFGDPSSLEGHVEADPGPVALTGQPPQPRRHVPTERIFVLILVGIECEFEPVQELWKGYSPRCLENSGGDFP